MPTPQELQIQQLVMQGVIKKDDAALQKWMSQQSAEGFDQLQVLINAVSPAKSPTNLPRGKNSQPTPTLVRSSSEEEKDELKDQYQCKDGKAFIAGFLNMMAKEGLVLGKDINIKSRNVNGINVIEIRASGENADKVDKLLKDLFKGMEKSGILQKSGQDLKKGFEMDAKSDESKMTPLKTKPLPPGAF